MNTFNAMVSGALIGFFALFLLVASSIAKQDKTTLRTYVGEFIMELGTLIGKEKPAKIPQI